jgi:hypothetical protein
VLRRALRETALRTATNSDNPSLQSQSTGSK